MVFNLVMKICLTIATILFVANAYAYDFGIVDAHKPVKVSVVLSNATDCAMRLTDVKSSCGCLRVDWKQQVLPKGGTLSVPAVMNLYGMEGAIAKDVTFRFAECEGRASGENTQKLRKANGGVSVVVPVTNTLAVVTIGGTSKLRLGLKPHNLAFGVVGQKQGGQTVKVKLDGYASTNAVITRLSGVSNPVIPVAVSDDARALLVTLLGGLANRVQGAVSEIWRVETSDPEVPAITFPVSARFSSGLSVLPQRLTVPANEELCSRTVLLRAEKGKKAFQVLSAETKPRFWGRVEVKTRPLNGWQIVVKDIDPNEVRQFSKQPFLEVKTDFSGMESFQIPIQVEGGIQ